LKAPVSATWGLLKDGTAVIEMAAASGLMLVPSDQRNPLRTTSYGTGELIRLALARGARRILLGIGGSATNDAGAGMAQALGVQFRDLRGRTLRAPLGGGDLAKVADIVVAGRDPRLAETTLLVACDVTNPLVGPRGASAIYGPQKGATPAQVRALEQHLRTFGRLAAGVAASLCYVCRGAARPAGWAPGLSPLPGDSWSEEPRP
jgi:glycerate kinase